MSELIKRLKEERVQGSSAVLNYSNFDYWINWDDIVDIVEGHDQPTLNDNQQVVLEWLKKEYAERNLFPTEVAWLLLESFDNGYFEPEEERAFENLNKLQEAQVLQAFSAWSLEQEEE